jgi:exopolysaccharide biosynthesis protein
MQIAYVGGKREFSGTYNGMPELVAANRTSLVMNGGYYTNDPSNPAGLLLVNGRIISPFNFRQSATLCVDQAGKLKIMRTSELQSKARSIAKLCADALQSYPIVVAGGRNDILPNELRRPTFRRSLVGMRADGSVVAVFFRSPVHLYVASEFLRGRQDGGLNVRITGVSGSVRSSGGLGIVDAVNLSGDTDSFVALNGKVLAGDANRQLPSAIVIK